MPANHFKQLGFTGNLQVEKDVFKSEEISNGTQFGFLYGLTNSPSIDSWRDVRTGTDAARALAPETQSSICAFRSIIEKNQGPY